MVPIGHFAVGMVPPFVATAALLPFKKRWLVYAPVVITLCGVWSLIPDVPVYFGRKLHCDELRWFTHEKIGDLFFFHKTIDRLDDELAGPPHPKGMTGESASAYEHGGVWGLALVVCMYFCITVGYVVYIRRLWEDNHKMKVLIRTLSTRPAASSEPGRKAP